jgi:hypothetical protein
MILKSCIGNRSLGYDLLPPSAPGYKGHEDPSKRPATGWYAGCQYDGDVDAARKVLADLNTYYPGAKKYKVAGFFFWQGCKEKGNADFCANYEKNLLHLLESLRKDFKCPKARLVVASIGETAKGSGGNAGVMLNGILNLSDYKKYKEHKGYVDSVDSNSVSAGGGSCGHYGGNSKTYQNIGQAMGLAMARMIQSGSKTFANLKDAKLDSTLSSCYKAIGKGQYNVAIENLTAYVAVESVKAKEQKEFAKTMMAHLNASVAKIIKSTQKSYDEGDYCLIRDNLEKYSENCAGILAYDAEHKKWSEALVSEKVLAEMKVGDGLIVINKKKAKTKIPAYFKLLNAFIEKNPDSFYAGKAKEEMRLMNSTLQVEIEAINELGATGDMFNMFVRVKALQSKYAKVPVFEEANEAWAKQAKDADVRKTIAAGKAYLYIVVLLDKLNEKLDKSKAKIAKLKTAAKIEKATIKVMKTHDSKLESLVKKLRSIVKKTPDNFYGKAAADDVDAFEASNGKELKMSIKAPEKK